MDEGAVGNISESMSLSETIKAESDLDQKLLSAQQLEVDEDLENLLEEGQFVQLKKKWRNQRKEISERKKISKGKDKDAEGENVEKEPEDKADTSQIGKVAKRLSRENPDLEREKLLKLKNDVEEDDSPEDILGKVKSLFRDPTNADDALAFLEQTSSVELKEKVTSVREKYNEDFGISIRAGRNITEDAHYFSSEEGLGTSEELKNKYRDFIINGPKNARDMFKEFKEKIPYEKRQKTAKFLLHAISSDVDAKKTSIETPDLINLMSENRDVLAMLRAYDFFEGRMKLSRDMCKQYGISEIKLTFKDLSEAFISLLDDRYPSSDAVLNLAKTFGISRTNKEGVQKLIVIFSQFRDAVRQVAPRLYRSIEQRDDLYDAIIDALEELEDQLDAYEEEE